MRNTIEIDDLIDPNGLSDCEFLFNAAEIAIYQDNDFYAFLLGRHKAGVGLEYSRCSIDWKDTTLFNIGKTAIAKLTNKPKPMMNKRVKSDKSLDLIGYQTIDKYKTIAYSKSVILLNRVKIEVDVPDVSQPFYKPSPGLNFAKYFKPYPYKYTIGVSTYYFLWKKSHKYEDLTKLLVGQMNWPLQLDRLYYDRTLPYNKIGGYPYLIFLIQKKYKYGTIKNYTEFLSCTILSV